MSMYYAYGTKAWGPDYRRAHWGASGSSVNLVAAYGYDAVNVMHTHVRDAQVHFRVITNSPSSNISF